MFRSINCLPSFFRMEIFSSKMKVMTGAFRILLEMPMRCGSHMLGKKLFHLLLPNVSCELKYMTIFLCCSLKLFSVAYEFFYLLGDQQS